MTHRGTQSDGLFDRVVNEPRWARDNAPDGMPGATRAEQASAWADVLEMVEDRAREAPRGLVVSRGALGVGDWLKIHRNQAERDAFVIATDHEAREALVEYVMPKAGRVWTVALNMDDWEKSRPVNPNRTPKRWQRLIKEASATARLDGQVRAISAYSGLERLMESVKGNGYVPTISLDDHDSADIAAAKLAVRDAVINLGGSVYTERGMMSKQPDAAKAACKRLGAQIGCVHRWHDRASTAPRCPSCSMPQERPV